MAMDYTYYKLISDSESAKGIAVSYHLDVAATLFPQRRPSVGEGMSAVAATTTYTAHL